MKESSEQRETSLKKLRICYSVTVSAVLLSAFIGWGIYLHSTMPERQLMMQLRRARTVDQIDSLLKKSPVTLSDDRMAEVYFNCAVNAFNGKNYDESCRILQKVLQSSAHPELKGSAHLEIANACFLAGRYHDGFQQLKILWKSPEIPREYKTKGYELEQYMKAGLRK